MIRHKALFADFIELEVKGYGIQKFLSVCGKKGIKLWKIRYDGEACRMYAMGNNYSKIIEIVGRGDWQMKEHKRIGPGKVIDFMRCRPGVIVGLVLAFLLVKLLTLFIWKIDFSNVEAEQQSKLRNVLMESDVFEGAVLREDKLRTVEQALYLQTEQFGWISLNFTGGCLFVEQSPLLKQRVYEEPTSKALYANSDAKVVDMEVKSGFTAVSIGQYVTKGQLLVDNGKFSRSGNLVTQNALGIVRGRIEEKYQAECKLESVCKIMSGKEIEQIKYYLMGKNIYTTGELGMRGKEIRTDVLHPIMYGNFVMPGYIRKTTSREITRLKIKRSETMAKAVANRNCKLQLLRKYPDADIKTQTIDTVTMDGVISCTCKYVFEANIAMEGDPPEHVFVAETAG